MLQSLIGRIRVPRRAKLDLDGTGPNLKVHFEAEHADGTCLKFDREYPGLLLPVQLVLDLKDWMKFTAERFFGRSDGGI